MIGHLLWEMKKINFVLLLSSNTLSMVVLDLFWILVAKFTVCDRFYVVNIEASCFFRFLSMK